MLTESLAGVMHDVSHAIVNSSSALTCSPAVGDLYIPPIWQSAGAVSRRQGNGRPLMRLTAALVERETARVVGSSGVPNVEGVFAHWC
jgi:hypothetical protein